jgi:hypothetical protein
MDIIPRFTAAADYIKCPVGIDVNDPYTLLFVPPTARLPGSKIGFLF